MEPRTQSVLSLLCLVSRRGLLFLGQRCAFALEDVQQRLRAFQDFHVGRLRLHDRLVVLVARGYFARQGVVDAREPAAIDIWDMQRQSGGIPKTSGTQPAGADTFR